MLNPFRTPQLVQTHFDVPNHVSFASIRAPSSAGSQKCATTSISTFAVFGNAAT